MRNSSENQQLKRHHSAVYYARRVRESLTTRLSKLICATFLFFLFIASVVTFILWLSLRPHRPRFYISDFSISGLTPEGVFRNATATFNVTARNPNLNIGIYYGGMDGTLYYQNQRIGSTPSLNPFYQPSKNTTLIVGELSGFSLMVNSADQASKTVAFRLELKSSIRFKVSTWSSKHHRMHANCEFVVGQDGSILATSKNKRCPVYFS